ncbi:shikimate 5-dehydrogenase [Deinobacterium chartae]|uniref:Shikimate 5-dehydrogenase n=1 Tax=Deinobacterium chartae TaxID=521158 RepID=A0A841HXE3_9DEIO|nr:shikimate dehydrogenase [Deinobacterium chartae]MBB6097523.1 shikimate 5-dehydrogenase [Deinobacterium chartae]
MRARPLALIGPELDALLAPLHDLLRAENLDLWPVPVRCDDPARTLTALGDLGFAGALLGRSVQETMLDAAARSTLEARRAGRADALNLTAGGYEAGYALEEALQRSLEAAHFNALGARLLVVGAGGALAAGAQLARLGFASVTVAADDLPDAQAALRGLPAGVKAYATSLRQEALAATAVHSDLIVNVGGSAGLPPAWLQPYHTLLDLEERPELHAALQRAGGSGLSAQDVRARRLGLRLAQVAGRSPDADALREIALLEG